VTWIGLYHPADSWVHRLPAGAKLIALVAFAVATPWLDRPWCVGVALALTFASYAAARIPARLLVEQLRPLAWFAGLLFAFQWWASGWYTAVNVVGTLTALFLLASLITLTTRTTAMVDIVVRMLGPFRPLLGRLGLEPERVGLLLSLGIRSVPVVIDLARQVREAQFARGLGASPTAFAIPLVVRSLRHADALGEALAARGADD